MDKKLLNGKHVNDIYDCVSCSESNEDTIGSSHQLAAGVGLTQRCSTRVSFEGLGLATYGLGLGLDTFGLELGCFFYLNSKLKHTDFQGIF